jgi:two-component SAPR family response regulator
MKENEPSIEDMTTEASEAEKNKDNTSAIKLYRDIIERDPLHIHSYDRLMKIYRQEKNYKKEISIINAAVKSYEKYYKQHAGKHSKKVSDISEKLNRSFGLIDKKGTKLYNPEPIGRWLKRKEMANKKLSK